MRLLPLARAQGLQLARDIPATVPGQMPLLRAGATITERYVQALGGAGIHAVWVHDELSEGIEPVDLVPPHVREEAARAVSGALSAARQDFQAHATLSPEVVREMSEIVEKLVAAIAAHGETALVLSDLAAADAYTHQHSIDVCALGILLARTLFAREGWQDYKGRHRLDGVERRLHQLGLGLLLHDIGKLAVPAEIINKPGALDDHELALMRTHPDAGAEMLDTNAYSPLIRAIVREHHERWDGQGYPQGLSGRAIHQLARIAAVADVYDAVTSERPYRPARPPHVGVQIIVEGAGTAFDAEVVDVFRRLVLPFPVGSEISLADGATGVVSDVQPGAPYQPLVRFPDGERTVDMAVERLAA